MSSASSTVKKVDVKSKQENKTDEDGKSVDGAATNSEGIEGEDTMKNLRKTFAGIFGDIN